MSNLVIGDDGWTEVVDNIGEMTRGGGAGVVGDDAYQILGELLQKSPALQQYVQRSAMQRAAANRPVLQKIPMQKARDWQVDFGPICSGSGTTTTITVTPQVLFRGEKVMATDSFSTAGLGTRIQSILVGQKSQRPATTNTLTLFFAQNALGNGIKWDTCEKGLSISVTVSFIQSCTFDMSVFGKAVL